MRNYRKEMEMPSQEVIKALAHLKYIISLSLESEQLEEDYKIIEKELMKKERRKRIC